MTKRQAEHKREIRKVISGGMIDKRIKTTGDWLGEMLSRFRTLMKQADPKVVEEVKWIKPSNPLGTTVWSHDGTVCTCEIYKSHVRLTFGRGASLKDPKKVFNSGFEGNSFRAMVLHEGEKINETDFKSLVRDAVALNTA